MILCPSCNADMYFNPEKQKLCCRYCENTIDPETYEEAEGLSSADSEYYETTVFSCPQCGGDIMSTDDRAATFCCYCGSSVILTSRMGKEKKPELIVPFHFGHEKCKELYKKAIKKAIYAPDYLRKDDEIDKFRGIYMPYWKFEYNWSQSVYAEGEKHYRKGDYLYTDTYNLECFVSAEYKGMSFDALSSFDDEISDKIGGFYAGEGKKFNPAYLSGFYVDNKDVEASVYEEEAVQYIKEEVTKQVKANFSRYKVKEREIENVVRPENKAISSVLYPVWFLANRSGERMTYAVINGQNGEISIDIPVDPKKYLIGSLITFVPLFFVFNFLLTLTPGVAMVLALILNLVTIIIAFWQRSNIINREIYANDRGRISLMKAEDVMAKPQEVKRIRREIKSICFYIQWIALILGVFVWLLNPVSDLIYYLTCVIVTIGCGISFVELIKLWNRLSTRKPPQLNKREGEEYEQN